MVLKKYRHYIGNLPLRSDRVYYTGKDTGYNFVMRGVTVADNCKEIKSIAVSVGGFFSPWVALFGWGISLFDKAEEHYNTTHITGSSEDYLQVLVNYDYVMQYTYVLSGDMYNPKEQYLGLVSQRSTVNILGTRQYYWHAAQRKGDYYQAECAPNVTRKSPHFDDPWNVAFEHAGGALHEEGISVDLGSVVVALD